MPLAPSTQPGRGIVPAASNRPPAPLARIKRRNLDAMTAEQLRAELRHLYAYVDALDAALDRAAGVPAKAVR